jgi:phosphotransferase system enzyme I (PtsI)
MYVKKGIPVSPGIAIAPAVVLQSDELRVRRKTVPADQVPDELARVDEAITRSIAEIEDLRQRTTQSLGGEMAKIFAFHQGMLADQTLISQVRQRIERERVTAEYAFFATLNQLAETFVQQEDRFFRERVFDIWDLQKRVVKQLVGEDTADLSKLMTPGVLVAHDLTPSQTASLDKTKVRAIITDAGGRTSHTAILAHALGIPAIVGLEDITDRVNSGDTLIVDGVRGVVVVEPDAAQLLEYRQELNRSEQRAAQRAALRDQPAVTKCGAAIKLLANIEFPYEAEDACAIGAEGVGLYRTEFLYLSTDHSPTEDEQYEAYTETIKALNGRPMTIRTLDLGADKFTEGFDTGLDTSERNPFLGCRSIRLCLQNLPLFKTQLRAILRASVHGPVRVMFPLISNIMELRQAKMVLSDVKEDLEDQGIAFADKILVGMMIEVPSAALQARTFAREVDFFSIGTNDLVQYTVAVDRGNERIASLYSPAHPAVIELLKEVIRVADRSQIDVSLCGEMAGQPEYTMLLLGLGLRSFSMTPPAIADVKQVIRGVSLDACRRVARKAAGFDSDREVLNYLRDELTKHLPEAFDGRSIG